MHAFFSSALAAVMLMFVVVPPEVRAQPGNRPDKNGLYRRPLEPAAGHPHNQPVVSMALLAHSMVSLSQLPKNAGNPAAWTELGLHVSELFYALKPLSFMGVIAKPEMIGFIFIAVSLFLLIRQLAPKGKSVETVAALDSVSRTAQAETLTRGVPEPAAVLLQGVVARENKREQERAVFIPIVPLPAAEHGVVTGKTPDRYRPLFRSDNRMTSATRDAFIQQERLLAGAHSDPRRVRQAAALSKDVQVH